MGLIYFLFGAIFGSAANALIYRLPRKISWMKGHSICPHCKHELAALDLIPLISFLFLGGKCRYCKKDIGIKYFLIELFLACGFAFFAGNPLLCAILWVTTIIAAMDWDTKLVSEILVLIWGILAILLVGQLNIVGALIGVGVIGGLWLFSKGRAMGFGDVEIAVVMGLWLGFPSVVVALWVAFVTGAVVGIYILFRSKSRKSLKTEIAFGPFLVLGSWFAYLFGSWMLRYLHV